jgi:DNA polymerase-3 subunit beta
MKCTTTREQLLEPLTLADKTTGKNLTVPVLSCLLLTVKQETLSITATNLEVGVRYTVSVGDTEDGVAAVSGTVLGQVVASLPPNTTVTLSSAKGHLEVESVGAVSHIALQAAEEFPTLPEVEDGVELLLPAKEFQHVVGAVAYCASTSTIKPELSSIFIHPDGGVLIAAATDSFRLAEKKVPLKDPVSSEPFLVPARSVNDLVRVLERAKGVVTVRMNGHQLSIMLPGMYMTLRLTAGTFPDYTQIIPKEFVSEATMLVFDIERALRKAAVFADQFNQTTITLAPKKKQFSIHTENSTVGETTDTVAAALSGKDLTINFNQRYLLDALQPIASDSITIQFAGPAQPAVIRPVSDDTFRYLVMPMNR